MLLQQQALVPFLAFHNFTLEATVRDSKIACGSGLSPLSLFWPRFSTVRLDRARQAYAGIVPDSTGLGRQPHTLREQEDPSLSATRVRQREAV